MAGTGKSTIARTVASTFATENHLGASFFFSKRESDRAHAIKFFTTIAWQLAKMSPVLKGYICQAIADNTDITGQTLTDQYDQLIFHPLSLLKRGQLRSANLFLVIDALDECESENDIGIILKLLAQANDPKNTIQLCIFMNSRKLTVCSSMQQQSVASLRIQSSFPKINFP